MYRLLVQSVTEYAIYMLTLDGTICNWNAGAEQAKGYNAAEIVGRHFSTFYTAADRASGLPETALATALSQGRFEGEGWRVRRDGSRFWAHVVLQPVQDAEGATIGFAKITRDMTERKKTEERITHLAHHDALTGLLNRTSFRDAVEAKLEGGEPCALLYLDLDRFKPINDTLGHLVGDKVLQTVAQRIARQLRRTDLGGRLGGDEFAVLLPGCAEGDEAVAAGLRLIRAIERPMEIDTFSVSVSASVGVAFTAAGHRGASTEKLLRNADLALYAVKKEERGTCRRYEPAMEAVLLQRKALETDLRLALQRKEFALHYQPVGQAHTGKVTGFEALIRWETPTRGKVSPAEFIPFAEEHGLMIEIGDWVLRTACAEAATWSGELTISINLSPAQFRSQHLASKIAQILQLTGLAAERLELEITETAMMGDLHTAKVILDELRGMGVMVAMDDFGTGYSSLSFLRMLPFTRIKIDRCFVQDLGKTQESLAIVRAVTGLCSSLGVATTAEGVETEEQLQILLREGCHELQGYFLGRPKALPEWNGQQIARETTLPLQSGSLALLAGRAPHLDTQAQCA